MAVDIGKFPDRSRERKGHMSWSKARAIDQGF